MSSSGSGEAPPLTSSHRTIDETLPPRPMVYNVMLCVLCCTVMLAVAAIIVAAVVIADASAATAG